ncbi:hypothetical protein CKO31_08775 [Thiohalocapsa halophila]|uniref:DUF2442 domain-containing protein n=1 Tax=Thiohalocapsa halophila TaxID=69359 RepID=A0ABS1CH70_9GAMM|nr:hypothetical protein [Thiohalocapsa halophila]
MGSEGIHWPALDEDMSVAGLLAATPSPESQQSLRGWLAGRASAQPTGGVANGSKGTSAPDLTESGYPTLRAEDLAGAWSYVRRRQVEIEREIVENEA